MISVSVTLLLLAATFVSPSHGALYTSVSQLPATTFDYVVIGAGAAGAVVANRLTENSKISVLLLEAGISDKDIVASQVPLLCPTLAPSTPYDWNFTTTAQPGFNGRSIAYPRGKILGGSTSLNYMVYNRGSKEDWDKYASDSGDEGWSWNEMQKYVKKNEKFSGDTSSSGKITPSQHSTEGILSVGLPGHAVPLDDLVIKTTKEQSAEWPFNIDMNSGNVLGIGYTPITVGNGTRSSSSTAYLAPKYMSRPNLHVLINAQVTKLIRTGTVGGVSAFRRVEFGVKAGAARNIVTAEREIIVSAGSVSTPQLLQLSGIGNPAHMTPYGIKNIVNLTDVGSRLSDHVLLASQYYINGNTSFDDIFRDPTLFNQAMAEWATSKSGPLVDTITNQLGWLRLPAKSPIFKTVQDPASGPKSSHWEIIFLNLFAAPGEAGPYPDGHFVTILTNLISPTSRGYVKIKSSSPFTAPEINPNFLSTPFDIYTMVEAFKAAKRLVASETWASTIKGPFGDVANTKTDAEVEKFVRKHSNSVWHPVGTASMSPEGAKWGVVNPDLTVKKTVGLRVVDASILPFVPNAHTQIPVYMVGERAADLIKADQTKTYAAEVALANVDTDVDSTDA